MFDTDYGLGLQVSTSMKDLCHDVFGVANEKKDARDIKGNRGISLLIFVILSLCCMVYLKTICFIQYC